MFSENRDGVVLNRTDELFVLRTLLFEADPRSLYFYIYTLRCNFEKLANIGFVRRYIMESLVCATAPLIRCRLY